ncbi:MAG: polysaccharide export protein [Sulfuricurvum sp.]|uniref:polysaccharide biosynthesis/export family protein n=1 Tax=Sulfuricurvum sp. TaxID=2025608 RepID=UPI00261A4579|nr:polysaccharide biosynthesis/export family protein [Sulfuricurvum sp.]MDD2829551.1 polysaccharide export protein [Sulfuricurvum sp.]MDD4950483.1 polysaccharide export protein [Sulfuricurvum sp.]
MKTLKFFTLQLLLSINLFAVDVSSITMSEANNSSISPISTKAIFGAHLFNGNFTQSTQHIYNPDYRLAIGDVVTIKMWGAFDYEQPLTIDSQGNIFIPRVGTVQLLGIRNGDLVTTITNNVKKVYRNNVYVYADMGAYQNVSLFVTGNVNKPGLYKGLSSDSLLQYIDKASGINPEFGSFRRISVLRDNKILKKIDLYDFMLNGQMELFAFRTGDVILVDSVGTYISALGEVQRPFRFEAKELTMSLSELARLSGIKPTATNAVVKNYGSDNHLNIKSYPFNKFNSITLSSGDTVEFLPDYSASNVQITIDGEHSGLHTLIVPKGTTLGKLRQQIHFNTESNVDAIQIYRKSVAEIQKKLIDAQLHELETLALTTSSVSPQEASMRSQETQSILQFIDRAKKVEPTGQITISDLSALDTIVLQEGDTIRVPTKNNIVVVQGEVALPGAFTYMDKYTLNDYIAMAGDISERANKERILVIRASGKAEKYDASMFSFNNQPKMEKGDSVLVLPKAESQTLQVASAITQILYQIAIAANVVLKF